MWVHFLFSILANLTFVLLQLNKGPSSSDSSSSAGTQTRPASGVTAGSTTGQSATSQGNANPASANPFSMFQDLFGGQAGAGAQMGGGAAGGNPFGDINSQFAQQLNNPEFMRSMLDNPLMQNLYSNPEIFRSIITSNPQFQQLIERNPELNHVLSNPEILRQTFDMLRNPAAMNVSILFKCTSLQVYNCTIFPGADAFTRQSAFQFGKPARWVQCTCKYRYTTKYYIS